MSKVAAVVHTLGAIGLVAQTCGDDSGSGSGGGDGSSQNCESQVQGMEASGTTAESDHDYYVSLCEEMK